MGIKDKLMEGFEDMFWTKTGRKMTPNTCNAMNKAIKETNEFAQLMAFYLMGDTTRDIYEAFPNMTEEVVALHDFLEEHGITIQEAVPIYNYSVDSNQFNDFKKQEVVQRKEEFIKNNLLNSFLGLYPEDIAKSYTEAISNYMKDYDLSNKGEKQIMKDVTELCESMHIVSPPVVSYAFEMCKLERNKENVRALENIVAKSEIQQDMVLYRAVEPTFIAEKINGDWNNLVGQTITNNFPTSTSKTLESSFATKKGYDLVFEINVPKGTKGIDIEPLSEFDKGEKEILLANNDLHIKSIRFEEVNGMPRVICNCDIDQREQLKNINNVNQKIDYKDGLSEVRESLKTDVNIVKETVNTSLETAFEGIDRD